MHNLESLSRGELEDLARRQDARIVEPTAQADAHVVVIARQDAQIAVTATQLAELMEKFEQQGQELAKLRHLLSRNSGNSSMPPSGDGGPGRTPPRKERRLLGPGREAGEGRRIPRPAGTGTGSSWVPVVGGDDVMSGDAENRSWGWLVRLAVVLAACGMLLVSAGKADRGTTHCDLVNASGGLPEC